MENKSEGCVTSDSSISSEMMDNVRLSARYEDIVAEDTSCLAVLVPQGDNGHEWMCRIFL